MTYFKDVNITQPTGAFGELLVAEKTPQAQIKFPYGINPEVVQVLKNNTSGGSNVTVAGGVATITAAGTYPSFSQIRSLDTVRYGPGQGSEIEYTASFTAGVALSEQVAGAGDDDEGLFFGYSGTSFGLMHHSHGELEIRSLTITGAADAGGGTFTITMDGDPITITCAGSETIAEVVELIKDAEQDFQNAGRGWEVHTDDNVSVEFISLVAENAAGTFSFADVDSSVTAGTFTQATTTVEGVTPTKDHVAQASWNIDPMDGTGPSGVTLGQGLTPDSTTLATENLIPYRIVWQYLGAGIIMYQVEMPKGGWQTVHVIERPGSSTMPSLRNPTLHLNVIVKTESGYTGGNLTVKTASMAAFIQGKETLLGVRNSAAGQKSVTSTTDTNLLTIHSELDWQGTRNKIVTYPDFLTIANEVTKTITVKLIVNPTRVDGTVALTSVDINSTPMEFDTAGTTFVGGKEALEWTVPGDSAVEIDLKPLDMFLRPGDRWIFSAAKTTAGTSGDVRIGVTWLDRV